MDIGKGVLFASAAALIVACNPQDTAEPELDANLETVTDEDRFADVTDGMLRNADINPAEWVTYGGTYDEQRYSRLDRINLENVSDLGVAWSYELSTNRGVESTPIVVDGVMYVTSAWSIVHALDAKNGEELWVYDPEVDKSMGVKACCDVVNRGVAIYEGKIIVGVIDGRLEALDAKTGERLWSEVTVDQSKPYTITGAPRVVDGKVLIGNGGAELGVRGYLSAYDADSGEMIWRFYTAPNPNKEPDGAASDSVFFGFANDTWGDEGAWVTDGGGGTVWDSIIYDQVNDLVIFGVGNGSPWNREVRDPAGGDNFFLSSIVAVKPDTGEYVWHFQTTPGDSWDYTATQSLIIADLPLGENGASRRVVMQAPKNGYYYVLDAATGEYLSADSYVFQTWTTGVDENGRPIESENARYGEEPVMHFPGATGGHNWQPMAFSPETNLAYIPVHEVPVSYALDTEFHSTDRFWNTGVDLGADSVVEPAPVMMKAMKSVIKGRLLAWDPVAGEPAWSVEHPNYWSGGVLVTAGGLVFQGQVNGDFNAYDAATGELKWTGPLNSAGSSGPATYEIDGEQYVTITTGWGSSFGLVLGLALEDAPGPVFGRVVTFKLGGDAELPELTVPFIERVPKAELFGDDPLQELGLQRFMENCAVCHGIFGVGTGALPDLRWSDFTADSESWKSVVIDGALSANGMVSFAQALDEQEAEAIRAYLVRRAHDTAEPVSE